jgi:CubicO group peptidase (beta-lactamase class C family)
MKSSNKPRSRKLLIILGSLLLASLILLGVAVLYLDYHLFLLPVPDDLDAALSQQIDIAKLPGMTVAVLNEEKVVFQKGYGFANLEEARPANPDTLYQVASVSKIATATALMRLYETGGYQLDDDINQFLPFQVRNPAHPETPITFRTLLAHTSSISDGPAYDDSYTLGISADPTEPLGEFLEAYFTPSEEYYHAKKNFTSDAPGETYHYSNVGFGLLGYLVERISGQSFNEYCNQEVFEPLGMTSTRWFLREVDQSRMAMPYGYNMLRRRHAPLGYYGFTTYPNGQLKTSTNDFAKLLFMFIRNGQTLDGEWFLQPETVQEMLRVQYPQSSENVGLAWHMNESQTQHNHSGGDPGVSTLVVFSQDEDWGLVIFSNAGGLEALRSTIGFQAMVENISPLVIQLIENTP